MLLRRTSPLLGLTLALATHASAAYGAPSSKPNPKAACVAAHEEGQTLRQQKKLHAAREKFIACAKSECPSVIRKECGEQIEALEAQAPSLAFEARDEKGNADPSVKVSIDGTVAAERLTGGSVDVEPGEHTIKFERADGKVIEQKILVVEGEKNRKVVADYASLVPKPIKDDHPPPPPPPEEKHVPLGAYVAGGVAVVALGSFAVFALTGKSNEDDLAGKCAPNCKDDEVKTVTRDYLIADISLGVAAVATIVAVVLALPALGSSSSSSVRASANAAPWFPKQRMVVR